MAMTLYPAMDLLHGKRLRHGRTGEAAGADGEPLAVASAWKDAGAEWLHVVDLDGALAGQPKHLDAVHALAEQTGLSLQVGGGLRTEADVAAAFEAGAARVVLEPAAGRNPELLAGCLARWGDKIVLSVDSRGGQLTVAGWLEILSEPALGFASRMAQVGVRTLLVTNVEREGAASQAASGDRVGLAALREALPDTRLIAAGEFASLDDIRWLAGVGMDGAVLGRALDDGTLELVAALAVCREVSRDEAELHATQVLPAVRADESEQEGDAGSV
jgi:phosphoribosylformimino-5-aminoimidazole carboxamide ribotide isomerase